MQRINGLAWCAQAVMQAAMEMSEAATGSAATSVATAESGFEHARVAAHLAAAAQALDAAEVASEACRATAARLREIAAEVNAASEKSAPVNLEGLEQSLMVLEDRLYATLKLAAPEERVLELNEHADRELAPYRSRMGAVQMRQVKEQFVRKQLLVHYNLPRLSLFYMNQQ